MSYKLSRKIINEMVKREQNISSRRSSGGSGAGGGGGVSSAWVDEHYVSKDFFARLFTIHSDVVTQEDPHGEVVEPNDLETDIDNIELMFGSWTEHYLSALGQGSGGGGGGSILTEPLATINESGMGTPSGANKVIVWNGITWTYMPYTTGSGTVTSVTMTVPTGFKVSNGDTQTINNSGTFALTFGGTITKNQVLASPAAANGTPAWRALVAEDIPTLTAAKISDITLTDGTLTIGNDSITPITDATLKSDYSWWGQTMNNNGAVTGNITVGDGDIVMNNNKYIYFYDSPSEGSPAQREVLRFSSNNNLLIGYGIATAGYTTRIYGNSIGFRYGTSGTQGMVLRSTGHLTINASDDTDATRNIYLNVGGNVKATKFYFTNSVYLEYNSSNSGVHLVGAGLYADTYLSALGAGSGGGGGSTLTEPLASINEAGMGSPSGTNKVIVYTSSGWSYMPYTTGGSGSVTSVGLSMPTGFNVTNTPVTGSGTLTVAFGGSVSKNRVLAAPSDAAGAPSWRKLVAADIPDLSSTYATDARMDTVEGYFTDGVANNAARLSTVSKTAWGQTYWTANGVPTNVSGTITVGNGDIVMNNNKYIYFTDNPSEGSPAQREVLRFSSANNLLIGYGTATAGYTTRIYGNEISFRYGTSGSTGMTLNSSGNFGIGTTSPNYKLDVNGDVHTSGDIVLDNAQNIMVTNKPGDGETAVTMEVLRLTSGNNLYLCRDTGTAGYSTTLYGSPINFRYGTSGTLGMALRSTGHVTINASDDTNATRNIYLNVGGNVKATKFYFTNSVYLEYDSSNSGVHLVGAGLYADTYVSALGAGSGGGSGSGITMNDVWTAMAMSAPNESSQQIHVSHLAQALSNYAQKTWVSSNMVTIDTSQAISGQKTFTGGIIMASNLVPSTDNQYSIGTEQKRINGVFVNGQVYVSGMTIHYQSGSGIIGGYYLSAGSTNIILETNGNVWQRTTSQYYSDMRLKDVISDVDLSVEQIAGAPVFNFKWKNADGDMQVGSSAQYWHKHLKPVTAIASNGQYGMDYGRAAFVSTVVVARKVMTHEERIAALERRIMN